MIILFENFNSDFIEVELSKMMTLTYSIFNRQGDKEYKWRSEAMELVKKLFTNKVITYRNRVWPSPGTGIIEKDLTDLVEKVVTYDDVDIPLLRMKFAQEPNWKTMNQSQIFKIWNDDSETAKRVRLEVDAKKYNL